MQCLQQSREGKDNTKYKAESRSPYVTSNKCLAGIVGYVRSVCIIIGFQDVPGTVFEGFGSESYHFCLLASSGRGDSPVL